MRPVKRDLVTLIAVMDDDPVPLLRQFQPFLIRPFPPAPEWRARAALAIACKPIRPSCLLDVLYPQPRRPAQRRDRLLHDRPRLPRILLALERLTWRGRPRPRRSHSERR